MTAAEILKLLYSDGIISFSTLAESKNSQLEKQFGVGFTVKDVPKVSSTVKTTCTCPWTTVYRTGCKCGGV